MRETIGHIATAGRSLVRWLLAPGSRKISLSSAPFYASILVIFALGLFVGIFWMFNEYEAYQESIDNIRSNYDRQYRDRLKEEFDNVIEFIEYERSHADMLIESEIRDKVQSAYTIASHMYRLYKDEKSTEELRAMVAEILRPIRWNNDRGYYFAGRAEDGLIDLFADEPWFEGKRGDTFLANSGKDVIGDIVVLVREKGAGLYHYELVKPEFPEKRFAKTAFVKYFEPFDWFIGAGIYTRDIEKLLQANVLSRIQSMRFGKDGEVFGFRADGTIICSRDERLIGRSVSHLVDANEQPFGKELLQRGTTGSMEGFVTYSVKSPQPEGTHQKLCYIKAYPDWGWALVSSMNMDEMEAAIAYETKTYKQIAFKNVAAFIVLFIVAVSFMLLIAYFYSLKIRQGIDMFTSFFRQAADAKVKIRNTDFAFAEFEDLGNLANLMIDDRIHKEQLLRRDELRLDTLLRLGMMEKHTLQQKYDFVLQRIVQITRSQEGYLALVNTAQTHITLCSYDISDATVSPAEMAEIGKSLPLAEGGLPGAAINQKMAIICNDYNTKNGGNIFPFSSVLRRHLDVPIYNDGRIVLVAGVCNNASEYDNADIRQMKMVLEGLWLHVLKTNTEQEMARLERQIIAVSEEERSNIGRDLHDDLGSHLTGVELLSKVLQQKIAKDDPDKAEQLGAIRNLIRDAIEKTRRLAQGLYPAHLVEHGLEASIEELVCEVEDLFKVQCTLSFEGDRAWAGSNITTHVYYIIREAVFNAARHGDPDNIGIFMRTDKQGFSVRIVDDGCGFDEKSTPKGLGCHTMKYRARAINASLEIESELNSGTIVTIVGEEGE